MGTSLKNSSGERFLLVEPVAKTPYPPLGLMKISSMLKDKHKGCEVLPQIGNAIPNRISSVTKVFISSLFTWDWKRVADSVNFYKRVFPNSEIVVGGIGASLVPEELSAITGVRPHCGLFYDAEFYPPDYSLGFNRKNGSSISFTTRGCPSKCGFCNVKELEPEFFVKEDWIKDINIEYPRITFWDNNFLASPNFEKDCEKIYGMGKRVDFNQGLDARFLDRDKAEALFKIDINPIRLAFDNISYENDILRAIKLTREFCGKEKEIAVYVLYNYLDTPEDLYYRINLLNIEGALSFPMEYREAKAKVNRQPGRHWNKFLLRAFKLSLLFYYRKGMISASRKSFQSIYGNNEKEFVSRLYEIYEYDKKLKRSGSQQEKSGGENG